MKKRKVTVEAYDPAWQNAFEKISREVRAGMGDRILSVEHVGSTSVPGLAAKPIIDLDVVIPDEADLEAVIRAMEALGYEHEGDLGIPGREAFRYDGKEHLMKHHLYVCRESSGELFRHLTFRNYLREHPEAAQEYGSVKQEGAALYPESIDGYISHKDGCIRRIYEKCGLN